MTERRALALTKGKEVFERARLHFAGEVTFIDVVSGVDVPSFTPEARTMVTIDAIMACTPFQHVVATSESHLAFAGYLRTRYGLPGLDYEQSVVATNKWRMKQAVRSFHPTAQAWLSGEFRELGGGHPDEVVVKPLCGSAAEGVRRMSAGEALQLLQTGDELLLIEEALDVTDELHCDGLVHDGALQWVVVSSYDRPVLQSYRGTFASVHLRPDDPRIEQATGVVRRVLPALPARDTVFHMELLQVGSELYFGEVGLRPAGSGIAESIVRCYSSDVWLEFVGLQLGVTARLSPLPRQRSDACGVIGVVPPLDGTAMSPEEALRLPGVTGIGAGNLPAGQAPANACSFSYLAFFEGLRDRDLGRLIAEIGHATSGVV